MGRKRKEMGGGAAAAADVYRESDPAMKLKCNELVCRMLEPYKGQRIMLLDGAEAQTTRALHAAGHALANLVVFNWNEETSCKIRAVTDNKALVVTNEVTRALREWPASDTPLFAGGWLDFCGTAPRAIDTFAAMLERKLVADDAAFAVTWCTRDARGSTFAGEKHQHSNDGESEIAHLSEEAGYALVKLPGAFVYKHMHFWSFRLRRCVFAAATMTRVHQSSLRESLVVGREHEVEALEAREWRPHASAWCYRVRWVGHADPTWEPAALIEADCPELVAAYRLGTSAAPASLLDALASTRVNAA
jgi:hypothetical protein